MPIRVLIVAVALFAGFVSASAVEKQLVVNKGMADERTFVFSELSRINFIDEGLEFVGNESVSIPFSQIVTFHFEEKSAVKDLEVSDGGFRAVVDGSRTSLHLSGLEECLNVDIYSVNGTRIMSLASFDGGDIDISALAPGLYIVKAGENVRKFVK